MISRKPFFPRLLCLFLLISFHTFAVAQDPVRGKVTSEKDNAALPGATISVKGKNRSVVSDGSGNFQINASNGDVLTVEYVNYQPKEVPVNGRGPFAVSLTQKETNIGEVVVTALGISKQSRSIGYAATNVKADELTINRTPNVMNALQGKVAGVNISGLGTGPAGTSKIRIRGQSSISGQNNPLIVINGMPIDNTNFGTNPNNLGSDNSVGVRAGGNTSDGGDGLQSINPDDIESMTILKGAPAAALYGSRAQNGVIMITTKTRGAGKGLGVSYNLNYMNDTPLDYTDYQYQYGQGENGVRPTTPNPTSGQWSFGEKFQPGMTQVLFNNLVVPYEPQYNRIRNFFRNGQNITNTVTIETGGDKGGLHLSLGNMDNKG